MRLSPRIDGLSFSGSAPGICAMAAASDPGFDWGMARLMKSHTVVAYGTRLKPIFTGLAFPSGTIPRVNPPPFPRHHRVLCVLSASVAAGVVGYRGPAFRPISAEATEIEDSVGTPFPPAAAGAMWARSFVERKLSSLLSTIRGLSPA